MIDPDLGWLHIHIPKTGGTSVWTALMADQERTQHETADDFSVAEWEHSLVFSFVRNPYDRILSSYAFHVRSDYDGVLLRNHPDLKELGFREYLARFVKPEDRSELFFSQVRYLTHSRSSKWPDFVGRFEHMAEDFQRLAELLGTQARLPHLKRSSHAAYRDAYDATTRRVVEDVYVDDLKRFDYTY